MSLSLCEAKHFANCLTHMVILYKKNFETKLKVEGRLTPPLPLNALLCILMIFAFASNGYFVLLYIKFK